MGSGTGRHAVYLARAYGARVTGIDLAATQHERAVCAHSDVDGVKFVQADVTEYLAGAEPFDAAYAIGTPAFIDQHHSRSAAALSGTGRTSAGHTPPSVHLPTGQDRRQCSRTAGPVRTGGTGRERDAGPNGGR
ncbi:class I SAM-dependent methyltransferase [Streptomyces sp. MI02-2A]|uniref:class I SAM-dependent methyltransferase n=1 Tax=Streptomyces sp. 3212.3 TaxID=1938846 RepID=UPI0029B4D934|nr:class I SAM-dependent methyltransferase [Streptomyces sp. 3212.3]MDX3266031.1 class I SAM-dependent methyltransferase [Streptomyces sp. MI02-2A]